WTPGAKGCAKNAIGSWLQARLVPPVGISVLRTKKNLLRRQPCCMSCANQLLRSGAVPNGLRGRGGRHGRAPGCAPTPYGGTKVGAPVRWAPGGGTLQHARGRGTAGAVYGLQGGAAAGGEPYRP